MAQDVLIVVEPVLTTAEYGKGRPPIVVAPVGDVVAAVGGAVLVVMVPIVQIAEGAMIGAMFGTAIESFLMRALMGVGQLVVEFLMPGVAVVVIVMRKRGHDGCGQ